MNSGLYIPEDIRVLTVHNRWENRAHGTAAWAKKNQGKWIAIHAGLRWLTSADVAPDGESWPEAAPGLIVCLARIGRVERNSRRPKDPWRVPGEWGIEITRVVPLSGIRLTGGQGWRRMKVCEPRAFDQVVEQLRDRPGGELLEPEEYASPLWDDLERWPPFLREPFIEQARQYERMGAGSPRESRYQAYLALRSFTDQLPASIKPAARKEWQGQIAETGTHR